MLGPCPKLTPARITSPLPEVRPLRQDPFETVSLQSLEGERTASGTLHRSKCRVDHLTILERKGNPGVRQIYSPTYPKEYLEDFDKLMLFKPQNFLGDGLH